MSRPLKSEAKTESLSSALITACDDKAFWETRGLLASEGVGGGSTDSLRGAVISG
ncbi:MAG: hypothetical protein JEY71_13625 [Sphaerochaeta sp.]|nr:hypothetical protein [Sphaerochaeta sp.]